MISRTCIHAIRALAELARLPEDAFAGATALARTIDAPENYLGKLLRTLARADLLESRKGLRGGFRLARAPESITLHDIVDPIEDLGRWDGCFLGRRQCSDDDPCAVHDRWAVLRDRYLGLLRQTTLAHLIEREPSAATRTAHDKRARGVAPPRRRRTR